MFSERFQRGKNTRNSPEILNVWRQFFCYVAFMSDSTFIGCMVFMVIFIVSLLTWQAKVLAPMPEGQEKKAKTFWFYFVLGLYIMISFYVAYRVFSTI